MVATSLKMSGNPVLAGGFILCIGIFWISEVRTWRLINVFWKSEVIKFDHQGRRYRFCMGPPHSVIKMLILYQKARWFWNMLNFFLNSVLENFIFSLINLWIWYSIKAYDKACKCMISVRTKIHICFDG